ncbi:hypothetical protein MPSEU_001064500 [Mayamaea pseudoterrestris]|nr:hypothetical protein MPSEU_001064500 [Mayamaea pseudoterrestris]
MSESEEKDHEKALREDADDLACLKDDDVEDEAEDVYAAHPHNQQPETPRTVKYKQELLDAAANSVENNQVDFTHAIEVLSDEVVADVLSKKHGRSNSPNQTHAVQVAAAAAAAAAAISTTTTSQEESRAHAAEEVAAEDSGMQQPLAGGLMLVHDGPPVEPLSLVYGGAWPDGWRQRVVLRKTGGRKGPRRDNYFYTPKKGYELLGVKKAKLFLTKLKECDGDEDKALECMAAPIV